jgi:phage terminase large subunit-like protein
MALKHDSVAVSRIEYLGEVDGRYAITTKFYRAANYDGRIPHDQVWTYIKSLATGLGFNGVVYDPRFFEVPARMLETDHGIQVIEFDQSPQRMAPACGMTYAKILDRDIVHNGDPDLWMHVNGACAVPQERGGFTIKKGKSRGHIDGAVTLCMGIWVLGAMGLSDYTVLSGKLSA